MNRFKLIAGIALSLALVGGLVVSLLDGDDTTATPIATVGPRSEVFGVTQGIRLDERDFQMMAATGVGADRIQLVWGSAQPSRLTRRWGQTDTLIGGLASHGIRAVPFVWGSARWVTESPALPPLENDADEKAWQKFLWAAVARYGHDGTFWDTVYPKRFGADAKPLPVEAWQIWNEPNLEKYFAPGPSVEKYARLLRISHDAIKLKDPRAKIVLAGMPGFGDVDAWDYLDSLYSIPGAEDDFDIVALHPYASNVDQLRSGIEKVRAVMKENGAEATPLWITEIGWGSAPPDEFGLNKGLSGQEKLLSSSFELIDRNREAWNVERVFWFDWRDPANVDEVLCSFCASAGLLRSDRSRKPAHESFKSFALEG